MNIYRRIFYHCYKIASITETQWSPQRRIPEWIANIQMSAFVGVITLIVLTSLNLIGFELHKDIGLLIPASVILTMTLNYVILERTLLYKLDAKVLDNLPKESKRQSWVIFILFVFILIVLVIALPFVVKRSLDAKIVESLNKIEVGMSISDFKKIIDDESAYNEIDHNRTLFSYELADDTLCEIEAIFDKNTLTAITYKKCNQLNMK